MISPTTAPSAISSSPPAALAISGLSHRFATRPVLHSVDLTVGTGELVCLVGPSGCGKTTLLRLAAGLEDVQAGSIAIDGSAVAERRYAVPAEHRGVGFVFQDYALFPHLDVSGNVAFGLDRLASALRTKRIDETLRQVGMQDHARAFPHQLSGGQQQRVALARALAPEPRVLLLDEPFSGLDARLREQIRDDTLHVLKQSGAATLMVTHDPEEAMFMADRLVIMNEGRIEQQGPPADVYSHPASAFVTSFFGHVNEVRSVVEAGAAMTPFGRVPVPTLRDGSDVVVLIRPEALKLRPADGTDTVAGRVIASRLLGRSSWIHLWLSPHPAAGQATGQADRLHFHARAPGRFLPAEGDVLAIDLDVTQAFAFTLAGSK